LPPVRRPARIVTLLLAAACALALGACGGAKEREANNTYVSQVNAAQNEFAATVDSVSQRITKNASSRQQRKTLADFQSAIDDVVRKLAAIKVPSRVKREHEQLVKAMSGFRDQIKAANLVLRNPTDANVLDARNDIASATQAINGRIQSAIAAINSKLRSS
jgi:hypothetical protein